MCMVCVLTGKIDENYIPITHVNNNATVPHFNRLQHPMLTTHSNTHGYEDLSNKAL